MQIVEPSYEIITPKTPEEGMDMLRLIEGAARTCYKSEGRVTEDGESARKLVTSLRDHGHHAMLEFGNMVVKFIIDRGLCYSDDTKVLTAEGWKFFVDITMEDRFYTLTDEGDLVLVKPIRITREPYVGQLHAFHSTQVNLRVTPNHNMWVYDYDKRAKATHKWKFLHASEMTNKRYKFQKSCSNYQGIDLETIHVPTVVIPRGIYDKTYPAIDFAAEDFMRLLGIWVTDGCISYGKNGSGNRISIVQSKSSGRNYIESVLSQLGLLYSVQKNEYRIKCPQLFRFLADNFTRGEDVRKTYYLTLPTWILELNKPLLKCFLEGVIVGDGTPHAGGAGYQIYTASQTFAENLLEIALKVGKSANIYYVDRKDTGRILNGNIVKHTCRSYIVSVVSTTDVMLSHPEKTRSLVDYDGYVYCVELPEHHRLYVMREGKPIWCGNSHELVRHRLCSFAQESSRYCSYKKGIQVIKPSGIEPDTIQYDYWIAAMNLADAMYRGLIHSGCKPQVARSVLPTCVKTELCVQANLRQWRHIFKLRTGLTAHPDLRAIMVKLLVEVKTLIPIVFDDCGVD